MADATVARMGLEGVIQVASFHPQYQFAGTDPDDITNYTNRSPYPILHLLREASVSAAVAAFPEAELIYQRNIDTMAASRHRWLDRAWTRYLTARHGRHRLSESA